MRDFSKDFPGNDSASVEYSIHYIDGVQYIRLAFFRRDKPVQFPIYKLRHSTISRLAA